MRRVCPVCMEELAGDTERCPRHGEAPDPRVGTVLDGRYRVDRRQHVGRHGALYQGADLKLARHVVLKTLTPPPTAAPGWRDGVIREIRHVAGLDHPNIVAIHDYAELADGGVCVVMERLAGKSVAEVVARSGPPAPRAAARVILQAAYALGAAHARNLPHGDVTPDNIYLVRRGDQDDIVKVLNFVSAGPLGDDVGALDYASPEVIAGASADDRSDIYSLAMVAYSMVTGEPAFPFRERSDAYVAPRSPREAAAQLPPAAEEALLQALHHDPRLRPMAIELFAKTFSRAVLETTAMVKAFDSGELDALAVSAVIEASDVRPEPLRGTPLTPLPATAEELDRTATGMTIPQGIADADLDYD